MPFLLRCLPLFLALAFLCLPSAGCMPSSASVSSSGVGAQSNTTVSSAVSDTVSATPGRYRHTLRYDGAERSILVQVPNGYTPGQSTPLVLVLHDEASSGEGFARAHPNVLAEANRRGWLLALPDGSACLRGRGACWTARDDPPAIALASGDDVGFLRTLLTDLQNRLAVDATRIYVTGFSNGANMTHRLAAEAPDLVAAAAPVAGFVGRTMGRTDYDYSMAPTPTAPVPMLLVKGLQDDVVLYHGGVRPSGTFQVLAAEYDANWWAEANGCDISQVEKTGTTGIADRLAGPYATHDYRVGCRSGATVRLVGVAEMNHTWPGRAEGYDATRAVFDFFQRH